MKWESVIRSTVEPYGEFSATATAMATADIAANTTCTWTILTPTLKIIISGGTPDF